MDARKRRAAAAARILDALYPHLPVPLHHADPYTLLVAVLLSAQCTDKRVNRVTPALFAKAATPQAMARLPVEEIRACIASCGLANGKAKHIKALSEMLAGEFGGEVPRDFPSLERLPGVGHKTAGVVMAHAFGIPAFPVDTHIHRLAQRWGLTGGRSVGQTEADLKKLWPPDEWERRHLQIIAYGREHCTARGCDGTRCEICRACFPGRRKPFLAKKA